MSGAVSILLLCALMAWTGRTLHFFNIYLTTDLMINHSFTTYNSVLKQIPQMGSKLCFMGPEIYALNSSNYDSYIFMYSSRPN
jgi:hypothetical protein